MVRPSILQCRGNACKRIGQRRNQCPVAQIAQCRGRYRFSQASVSRNGVLSVLTTGVKKVFHELYLSFVSSQPFFGEMISLSLETGSGNFSRFWEVYSYVFNDRSNRSFVIGKKILIIKD